MAHRFTKQHKADYVKELRKHGEPALAAEAVGFSLGTIRKHGSQDPEFAEAAHDALQAYRADIAHEIHRRAIEGWDEPVFHQGEIVGTKRKYSDALLALHAKRHMPQEYGEKKQITHTHETPLDLTSLPPEKRELLRKLLELPDTPPPPPPTDHHHHQSNEQ